MNHTATVDRNGVLVDDTIDTYFGVEVPDPYRHLEDGPAPETRAWTERQNEATHAALDGLPGRAALKQRFDDLRAIGLLSVPIERGERCFYTSRSGKQEQSVLMVRERGADRVLVDPLLIDPSGLTSLTYRWYPSPNGRYVVFGLSVKGNERVTLSIVDATSGTLLADQLPHTRYTRLAWLPDESAFFYTRPPADDEYNDRLFLHVLGTSVSNDPIVFGGDLAPEHFVAVDVSPNGRWLLVHAYRTLTKNDLYLRDLRSPDSAFVTVSEGRGASNDVCFREDEIFIRSSDEAARYALYVVDTASPSRDRWRTLIPESDDILDMFTVTRDHVVTAYMRDVQPRLRVLDRQGRTRDIALPPFGAIEELSGHTSSDHAYVLFSSFTQPQTVYRLEAAAGSLEVWEAISSPVDASRYRVEQAWCSSADGTRVPMFILSHAATPQDTSAPAVVTAYATWGQAYLPSYTPSVFPWLDAGGLYVIANCRGGGELGLEWERAGMNKQRQHTFDDFSAVAEFLGSSGHAHPSRIGIIGESQGGGIVCVSTVQRPELFRAVVAQVPICDMLRRSLFGYGRLHISGLGDPNDPEYFPIIHAYSAYHNVREGAAYPAMLFLTSDGDKGVDPLHTRKMVARLQAATSSDRPILAHVEKDIGHSFGRPRHKQVEELTNIWSFFAWQLSAQLL